MKFRSRASCQLEAKSAARPDAVVSERNWLAAIWRFAFARSSSSSAPAIADSSSWMAVMSASRFSGRASALMPKRPSRPGPVQA